MSHLSPLTSDTPTPSTRKRRADLLSDWEILNNAKSKHLYRLSVAPFNWTEVDIRLANAVLAGYHTVYRQDLMRLRAEGCRGRCPLPTEMQLQQIAQWVQRQNNRSYSSEQIICMLRVMAQQLRSYD